MKHPTLKAVQDDPPPPIEEERADHRGLVLNGRFELVTVIGTGGTGIVYRAVDRSLGREVAVKVLDLKYDARIDPSFRQRFADEAVRTAKLAHPNVVTIFDLGQTGEGLHYIAMELLQGRPLNVALRESGAFHWQRAIDVGMQVCRAVREAHSHGLVHRDLKPANIFLIHHIDDEQVKVLDFGLARPFVTSGDDVVTQPGIVFGSPTFMAPEQARNEVSPQSDIYSFGIVLFAMLAGRVPFTAKNAIDVIMQHMQSPVPWLSELRPGVSVPRELELVVRRCLEKDPKSRFSSMAAVLEALKRARGYSTLASGAFRSTDLVADSRPASGGARPPPLKAVPSPALLQAVPPPPPAPIPTPNLATSDVHELPVVSGEIISGEVLSGELISSPVPSAPAAQTLDDGVPRDLRPTPPVTVGQEPGATVIHLEPVRGGLVDGEIPKLDPISIPRLTRPAQPAPAASSAPHAPQRARRRRARMLLLFGAVALVGLLVGALSSAVVSTRAKLAALEATQLSAQVNPPLAAEPEAASPAEEPLALPPAAAELTPTEAAVLPTASPEPGPAAVQPPVEVERTPPPPPVLQAVRFRVNSIPAGATVRLGGKPMGPTPTTFEVMPDAEGIATANITLELDGYQSMSVTSGGYGPEVVLIQRLQKGRGRVVVAPPLARREAAPPKETTSVAAAPVEVRPAPTPSPAPAQPAPPAAPPVPAPVAAVSSPPPPTSAAPTNAAPPAPSSGPLRLTEAMRRPELIDQGEAPVYTREAVTARSQGTALARCVVTLAGRLERCLVVKSVPLMDAAVIKSLSTRRYRPAELEGKPVEVEMVVTSRLALRN